MRKTIAGLLALSLGGCAGMMSAPKTAFIAEATPEYVAARVDAVRNVLKDPESARFSGIYVTKRTQDQMQPSVCGYINAKNSYGGYTGKKMFVSMPSEVHIEKSSYSSRDYEAMIDNNFILTNCGLREGERLVLYPGYAK